MWHTHSVCPEKDHCVAVCYRNGFGVTSERSFVAFEAQRVRMGVLSKVCTSGCMLPLHSTQELLDWKNKMDFSVCWETKD